MLLSADFLLLLQCEVFSIIASTQVKFVTITDIPTAVFIFYFLFFTVNNIQKAHSIKRQRLVLLMSGVQTQSRVRVVQF